MHRLPRRLVAGLLACGVVVSAGGANLRELGAKGNGDSDDTQVLQAALADAAHGIELDGEGLSYRVTGTLTVRRDLTLRRLRLLQHDDVPDGVEGDKAAKTLLVAGTEQRPVRVVLEDVHVHRGANPRKGSPGNAGGIWLAHVADSVLSGVVITGNGRGAGLVVVDSRDVEIYHPRIHDMVWAPCAGQAEGLPWDEIRRSWNSYLVMPMDDCADTARPRIRIREPLAGIVVGRSQRVTIRQARVHRLMALFADGRTEPWQTDGISVRSDRVLEAGRSLASEVTIENPRISQVWEGIDLLGQPLTSVRVINPRTEDTHAFGVKVVNGARDVVVEGGTSRRSGIAGFVVAGTGNRAAGFAPTHQVQIRDSRSVDTGAGARWRQQATIAGFRVMQGAAGGPGAVTITGSRAVDRQVQPTMSFGLHSECAGMQLPDFQSVGHVIAPSLLERADCF